MASVKIIGVGSAHGSDAAGWLLVEALRQEGFEDRFEPGAVELHICRFPAQLVSLMADCETAVILDAVRQPPGSLTEYSEGKLLMTRDLHSTHGIGVGEALALAERMLPQTVQVRVIGVGVEGSDGVTAAEVDALLPDLKVLLSRLVE